MEPFPHQFVGPDGAVLLVRLPAAVNHLTAEPLRQSVQRLLPNRDDAGLILDCAEVNLVTSIGIAAFLQIQEFCDDAGARMALASVSPAIRRMLTLVKLDQRFRQAPGVDEALALVEAR